MWHMHASEKTGNVLVNLSMFVNWSLDKCFLKIETTANTNVFQKTHLNQKFENFKYEKV